MVKHYHKKDPNRKEEAKRYTHPVPSRSFIIQYLEHVKRPVTFGHLLQALEIKTPEETEGLRRRLIAMERDGQLIKNRRDNYALVKKLNLIRGRIQAHREGYGFLIPDKGSRDVFLPAKEMQLAFNDDVALIRIINPKNKRLEGAIVEVLEHNTKQVVGRFYEDSGVSWVDPTHKLLVQNILIPKEKKHGAKAGEFVIVNITSPPTRQRPPVGEVTEILGNHLTPGLEVELATQTHQLPHKWSEIVLQEAQCFPHSIAQSEFEKRKNLTHLPFLTIDGEDAKDFDDAIYCEKISGGGWRLYVAIADVAHYVTRDSALDHEARLRGNSVYFPQKVIPMLPEILSNELCSLKPNKDRLVVACEIQLTAMGQVRRYQFYEAIICSHARLTYNHVAELLDPKNSEHPPYLDHVKLLHQLFQTLYKQRKNRGAIEFETIETKITFDKNGKILVIFPLIRNDAHRIVEECMLLANVCASRLLQKANLPTLYRVHEGPDPQKLKDLKDFLRAFGLRLSGGEQPTPKDYRQLLHRIEKRQDAHLLQMVLLRSLRQAIYTPKNVGHFGLSYEGYCHFTSPIRRYPDLIIHRGIKYILHHPKKLKKFYYTLEDMTVLGEQCSMTERRADRATRDAIDWLKCEYISHKLGQTFQGRIVDVTGFGIFVELDKIYVQGLVHITALKNDYYYHDPIHHLLRGKQTGTTYQLGDSLTVQIARVDLAEKAIDFELVTN